MDIFGGCVTVINQVYHITIFIKGVVADIKAYNSDRRLIQDKLEHEFLFLDTFKKLFFDEGAFMRGDQLNANLKRDIYNILTALRKSIDEYGLCAAKHGMLYVENENQLEAPFEKTVPLLTFRERLKFKMRDLRRTLDWALFDREKILKTLDEYSEWTGRLRQTMSLVLLTVSAFQGLALKDFGKTQKAKNMGIDRVISRQILAGSDPPDDFQSLAGSVLESPETGCESTIRLAKFDDDWSSVKDVVVEYRDYSKPLVAATDLELPNLGTLKAPVRQLAWLLHKSSFSDEDHDSHQLSIFSLPCLGYIDQPEHYRTAFLYQLPVQHNLGTNSKVVTLNEWINAEAQKGMAKPSLGNRFFLAYALALTVFNVHCSGWIHKNIWSHGIIMFPSSTPKTASDRPQRILPYLAGWGAARRIAAETELGANLEPEPNFYQHPVRQGYPEAPFSIEHDIYSLGVVLLELGLWKTISQLYRKQIDRATVEQRLPPPTKIRDALVEKARQELPNEMGILYAKAVERCLKGDFGVSEDDEKRTGMSTAFRANVVDVVAKGMDL